VRLAAQPVFLIRKPLSYGNDGWYAVPAKDRVALAVFGREEHARAWAGTLEHTHRSTGTYPVHVVTTASPASAVTLQELEVVATSLGDVVSMLKGTTMPFRIVHTLADLNDDAALSLPFYKGLAVLKLRRMFTM
jgi:hypothetical protein